jgi:hypothetical protein
MIKGTYGSSLTPPLKGTKVFRLSVFTHVAYNPSATGTSPYYLLIFKGGVKEEP